MRRERLMTNRLQQCSVAVETTGQVDVANLAAESALSQEGQRAEVALTCVHEHDACVTLDKEFGHRLHQAGGHLLTMECGLYSEPFKPAVASRIAGLGHHGAQSKAHHPVRPSEAGIQAGFGIHGKGLKNIVLAPNPVECGPGASGKQL